MTWSRLLATGYGTARYRLAIAGHPDEFVSEESMERVASGSTRARVALLNSSSFKLSEKLTLVDAKTSGAGFTAKIVDHLDRATASFKTMPTARTLLAANISHLGAPDITVLSTEGFADSGFIWIDSEVFFYGSKTATTFEDISRPLWNTVARAHYVIEGEEAREPEVTNRPVTMDGRRAYLYAYGDGDNPLGDGTQIWKGIVSSQPRYNGTSYAILIDPITRVLKQQIGGFLDLPVTIRGIYYHVDNPLVIYCQELSGANSNDAWVSGREFRFQMCGFWETQADFLAALQTQLTARATGAGFNGTLTAIEIGGVWGIALHTAASSPRYLRMGDALLPNNPIVSDTDNVFEGLLRSRNNPDGLGVDLVNASEDYVAVFGLPFVAGGGTVPRASLGGNYTGRGLLGWGSDERVNVTPALFPSDRLYLDTTPDTRAARILSEWKANGEGVELQLDDVVEHFDTDIADRWIRLGGGAPTSFTYGGQYLVATAANAPELEFLVTFAEGSLTQLITQLVADSVQYANLGLAADFEAADFEMGESQEVHDAAVGFLRRSWAFTGAQDFEELLIEELKLVGGYLLTTASGGMAFRLLRHATQVEVPSATITPTEHVVSENWLHHEGQPLGVYNTISIKTGYDPVEDDYFGREWIYRDRRAFGRNPKARILEIKPKSREASLVRYEDTLSIASRVFGMFAGDYEILRVDVKPSLFGVLLGDVVAVTSPKVPNSGGVKGIEEKRGIVVSREWQLVSNGGLGSLEILMTDKPLAGYSPAALVVSADFDTGTTWEVELDQGDYPPGTDNTNHWQPGDLIRVTGFNSGEATVTGVVDSVEALTLVVTLDGAFPLDSTNSSIHYQRPSAIEIDHATDGAQVQHAYGAIANAEGRIIYLDFEASHRVFAP